MQFRPVKIRARNIQFTRTKSLLPGAAPDDVKRFLDEQRLGTSHQIAGQQPFFDARRKLIRRDFHTKNRNVVWA